MTSLFSLDGRKILVTGGAQGIGKAVSIKMAEAGANLGILDLNGEGANQFVNELQEKFPKQKFCAFQCNVTDYEEVHKTVDAFAEFFGGLDGLFLAVCLVCGTHRPLLCAVRVHRNGHRAADLAVLRPEQGKRQYPAPADRNGRSHRQRHRNPHAFSLSDAQRDPG